MNTVKEEGPSYLLYPAKLAKQQKCSNEAKTAIYLLKVIYLVGEG